MTRWCLAFGVAFVLIVIPARSQSVEPITDPDSYELYRLLVPPMWTAQWSPRWQPPLLLLSETDVHECQSGRTPPTPEWRIVVDAFVQQNARPRPLVSSMLRFDIPHTLISRAEIDADDARLAVKYPGTWQSRPESIEYAAVSAVGFNADKTKAMLYVKMRSQGSLYFMEKRGNTWSRADHPSCGWIV